METSGWLKGEREVIYSRQVLECCLQPELELYRIVMIPWRSTIPEKSFVCFTVLNTTY